MVIAHDRGHPPGQVQLCTQAAARLVREVYVPDHSAHLLIESETDVLWLLALGQSNEEISQALGVGE